MKGEDVKKILSDKKITQSSVAENMGETVQNLQSMLKAKDIKTGTLERIAKASGIPLAEFLGHDNDVNYQSGVNTYNTTANASEFIQEIKAQRESYESIIKDLISKIK